MFSPDFYFNFWSILKTICFLFWVVSYGEWISCLFCFCKMFLIYFFLFWCLEMLWIEFFFYFVLFLFSCLISFLFGFVELFWIECFRILNHSTFLNWLVCFFLFLFFVLLDWSLFYLFLFGYPQLISFRFGFVGLIHLFSPCFCSWMSNLISVPGRFAKHIINWRLFHLLLFRYPQLISFLFWICLFD